MTTQVIAYLHSLSMYQLRDWAGATITDRGHGCVGAVRELSLTADGTLAAWVDGSETYATAVRIEGTTSSWWPKRGAPSCGRPLHPPNSSRPRGRAPQVGYPEVQILLQTLLARGAGDAVLELGDELLREGVRQLESSHDDDHSAYELGECMDVVMATLPHSSLSPSDYQRSGVDIQNRHSVQETLARTLGGSHPESPWSCIGNASKG